MAALAQIRLNRRPTLSSQSGCEPSRPNILSTRKICAKLLFSAMRLVSQWQGHKFSSKYVTNPLDKCMLRFSNKIMFMCWMDAELILVFHIKWINYFYPLPLKSSENYRFSDDFGGDRSLLQFTWHKTWNLATATYDRDVRTTPTSLGICYFIFHLVFHHSRIKIVTNCYTRSSWNHWVNNYSKNHKKDD